MSAYSDYLTQVRRLLHDANGQFWSDSELNDYVNEGRKRTVKLTGCYRQLQSFTTGTTGSFNFSSFGITPVIDVVNCTVQWGNSRPPISYMPWTRFSVRMRYWTSYVGRPAAWSVYAYNKIYFGPVPDQNYTAEADTVVQPPAIVDGSSVEVIPEAFTSCPQYWAAHLAKIKAQAWGEAAELKKMFTGEILTCLNAVMTRRSAAPGM